MITKEQFENAYRKFPPSRCESFYLKNLSISSLQLNSGVAIILTLGLAAPFLFAIIGHTLKWPMACTYIPSFIYSGILALMGFWAFLIWLKRHKRLSNIRKELGCTKKEYTEIVKKYYYENYYPDIKDYINSILPKDK